MDVRAAVHGVAEALAGVGGVRAILHNGSHVAGTAQPGSDIDFTVLLEDELARDAVIEELDRTYEFLGHLHEVPHYREGEHRLAVCVYPQAWTDDWVGNAFRSANDLRQWQGWLRHKVVDAVAVLDPGGVLAGYQERLARYPEALAEEIAAEALAHLRSEYLEGESFRGAYHFAYCLRDILEHLATALYARNRRLWAPPLKYWQHDLPSLRPRLEGELARLVTFSAEEGAEGKGAILAVIVAKLEAR